MILATTNTSELVTWLASCLGRGDLSPVSSEDLKELAGYLSVDRYAGGTAIYHRDVLPERVHILRSGTVELTRVRRGAHGANTGPDERQSVAPQA
jgi:hypothetical protein